MNRDKVSIETSMNPHNNEEEADEQPIWTSFLEFIEKKWCFIHLLLMALLYLFSVIACGALICYSGYDLYQKYLLYRDRPSASDMLEEIVIEGEPYDEVTHL